MRFLRELKEKENISDEQGEKIRELILGVS